MCCFIPELQKASAFALPISLHICDKRPVTHLGTTKILRLCMKLCTKPQTSQSCHWLCHSHLPALPQLAQDFTVMKLNYMVTWKTSHKSRVSYSVLKMAGAYSVWMFNTFFSLLTFTVILQNDLLSLLQKHNQLTHGSLHCSAHEFSLTKHAFFIAS